MELIQLLGERSQPKALQGQQLFTQTYQQFVLESYLLQLNGLESVSAYHLRTKNSQGPLPTVIFQHSHGGRFDCGKQELISGSNYLQKPSIAEVLTGLGFGVWAIDAWGFGDRRGISESELYKQFLVTGRTLWGMRLFDLISLLDYLETREDVDPTRIATLGMSMGGLLSWWLSALDTRVKVCVDIAAQVDMETLLEQNRLDAHGMYYYIPNLLKYFSTKEIQTKIAPRARISMIGKQDTLCVCTGARTLNQHLKEVYTKQNAPQLFSGQIVSGGHHETADMRYQWQQFLREQL